jgi:hypothetical protein
MRNAAVPRMSAMSAGSKLAVVLAAALLAIGLVACGDDDGSGSTTTEAVSGDGSRAEQGDDDGSGATPAKDGGAGETSDDGGSADGDDGGSDDFVPESHDDSGGGSAQYRVKGGDNSVQEFGAEAEDAERDAAAAALHNFLDARAQEAWESACSYLSAEVRESLESFAAKAQEAAAQQGKAEQFDGTSCGSILGKVTNRAAMPELRREAAQADVGSLREEGDRAFLIYTGLGGTVIAIPVTQESGSWKVAALGGTPLN